MAEKTEKKYVITNHRSGKVLASCGGSAVQMTANGGETQVWCAVPAEGTSVQLVHIKDISDADGAPAQLWEFVKGDNQNWVLTEVEKEKKAPAKCAAKTAKPAAKEKAKAEVKAEAKPEVKAEVKAEAKPAAKTTKAAAKITKTAKKTK